MLNEYFDYHTQNTIKEKMDNLEYLLKCNLLIIKLLKNNSLQALKISLEEMFEHKIDLSDVKIWHSLMIKELYTNTSKFINSYREFGYLGFCPYI